MSSFGGETPVGVVSQTFIGNNNSQYTVPSGKYFKGRIMGEADNSGSTVVVIDLQPILTLSNNESFNQEIIMHSGQVFGANTGNGTDQGILNGLLYNNP